MDESNNDAVPNGNITEKSDIATLTSSLSQSNKKTAIDDIIPPSELRFDEDVVEDEVLVKKQSIESCLLNPQTSLEKWQSFAKSKGGLICDELRRKIWPMLMSVTEEEMSEPPTLADLENHDEYHQVVLDVNRSLKRFPPGIPYEQRVALQDQLTILILRVIMKYPNLKYYQGYHDIAITLLLVCGDRASFPLLYRLSKGPAAPLEPFMQLTMQPAQHLLNYLYPLLLKEHPQLGDFLQRSTVGTIFALPWFVTWFGHSLNRYTDVVRLYDYFLCSPPLFPIYVTAAIVLHRQDEILECDCDMATVHCLLSKLPDDLPFEDILKKAEIIYSRYDPEDMEREVVIWEQEQEAYRKAEEETLRQRMVARRSAGPRGAPAPWTIRIKRRLKRCLEENAILRFVPVRYRALLATATVLVGVYAFYRPDLVSFAINR